jgi:LytS/YehU family sensor histidine kinase
LRFHWEIADAARRALVPRLLLQPLVENAVNHGALKRSGGGVVTIRVRLEETETVGVEVVCEIEDNGPGMPAKEPRSGAFGLHSVNRRLALKYQGASLRFESNGSGTRSIVRLPRVASRPPALAGQAP